jgi:hypothetical protein
MKASLATGKEDFLVKAAFLYLELIITFSGRSCRRIVDTTRGNRRSRGRRVGDERSTKEIGSLGVR